LNILASSLLQVVDCEPLQLISPYASACFGHAMSKAVQYATSNDQMCVGMTCVVENCPINLAKDNDLDKEEWQRLPRVGQGL
jgi:hypothetical protein